MNALVLRCFFFGNCVHISDRGRWYARPNVSSMKHLTSSLQLQ
uniref:Uncharacterized protein n=1 Tax=Arundo donax TaxID=35708 RepID=A0A0A9U6U9_ARUDO